MTHTARLAREDAITEALRAADMAIGDEPPTDQALRIIAALQNLRSDQPARVTSLDRIDYLEHVQTAAQRAWQARHDRIVTGPDHDATAGIDTPIGRLKSVTWRRAWASGRIAWASEYYLNDAPITVAEIRAAGLAQRPTTRKRRRSA